MTDGPGAVVVTGATGLLGRELCRALADRGWEVRAWTRDVEAAAQLAGVSRAARCELPGDLDVSLLEGADALVHAAWPTRTPDRETARCVGERGTVSVLEAARNAGIRRILFVSSIAAAPEAPQFYARSKAAAETLFDPERDLVVRLGLILSREGEGIFRQVQSAVKRLGVVPAFEGGTQPVQTIHIDDVCEGIARALDSDLTGRLQLAAPESVTLADFARLIADRLRARVRLVPLPFGPVLWAVRALEALHLPAPLSSESLMGVKALRTVETRDDLGRLGLEVRSTPESVADLLSGERQTFL